MLNVTRGFLTGALAFAFIAVGKPAPAQSGAELVSRAPLEYREVDGVRFAFRRIGSGDGPPTVMLTRFRATMDDWDPLFLEALAQERPVILLDNRGVGASSGEIPDTIKAMADDVARFARGMGFPQVDLVGWSMGGPVATITAIEHPQLVRRFVVMGSTPPGQPVKEEAPTTAEFRKRAAKPEWDFEDFVFLFFRDTPSSRAAARASFDRLSAASAKHTTELPREKFQHQSAAIRGADADREGYLARFAEIRQPSLVISGDRDAAFPLSIALEYHRRLGPGSRLAVLPNAGHAPHGQYPEAVASFIKDFLR